MPSTDRFSHTRYSVLSVRSAPSLLQRPRSRDTTTGSTTGSTVQSAAPVTVPTRSRQSRSSSCSRSQHHSSSRRQKKETPSSQTNAHSHSHSQSAGTTRNCTRQCPSRGSFARQIRPSAPVDTRKYCTLEQDTSWRQADTLLRDSCTKHWTLDTGTTAFVHRRSCCPSKGGMFPKMLPPPMDSGFTPQHSVIVRLIVQSEYPATRLHHSPAVAAAPTPTQSCRNHHRIHPSIHPSIHQPIHTPAEITTPRALRAAAHAIRHKALDHYSAGSLDHWITRTLEHLIT
jgi:hypothetical protein